MKYIEEKKWMACEIELAITEWLLGRNCTSVITHFYPSWWHECDVYSITRSGYGVEIEVKISITDFWADFKKKQKHKALAAAITNGHGPGAATGIPRRYYFAVPDGMIDVQNVPDYAGLLYVKRYKATQWSMKGTGVIVVKQAPNLQPAKKLAENQVQKLSAAYKFHYYTTLRQLVKARSGNP